MKKVINVLFTLLKYLLLVVSFGLMLFIILRMYTRLGKSLTEAISIFLPYILLLILFVLNVCLKRKGVTDNLFYNITCTLVFATNIIVCVRAIVDKNMLFNGIQKMGVNFNYFNDYLSFNRIMLYGLIIANIVFMLIPNNLESKKKVVIDLKKEDKKPEIKKIEEKKEVIAPKIEIDDEII